MSDLILTNITEEGDLLKVRHTQKVGGILRDNYECRKNTDEIWNKGKDMKQVASIDLATFLELQKHGITEDTTLFLRWLENHPEYKVVNKTLSKRIQHF